MEEIKAEYESKVEEYAQLLDIRAARIRVSCLLHSLYISAVMVWTFV